MQNYKIIYFYLKLTKCIKKNIFCHYKIMTKNKKKISRRWSIKYKKSINCNRPKGFSQKQYCKYGRKNYTKKY
jgi:hypothetical protein